jgi:hypothetical protein
MRSDSSNGLQIAEHQTCVVYDRKTGRVAHIHDSITFAGAERPTKDQFEARAMDLARQLTTERRGLQLDRLEILHVHPDELEHVAAPRVDVKTRRLLQAEDLLPGALKPKKDRTAKKRKTKRSRARK